MPTSVLPFFFKEHIDISQEEFNLLRDFIYEQSGIYFADNRKYLLKNRLGNRLDELELKSYAQYHEHLTTPPDREKEKATLFDLITTNETSFFRNTVQLGVFQEKVLAECVSQARSSGKKKLRIWSAGCSSGEEPHTIAIILHEVLKEEIDSWDIKITGTDLSEHSLRKAAKGIYTHHGLRTTPPGILSTYFQQQGNRFHIAPEVAELVHFQKLNLKDESAIETMEPSHVLFCRNVIIYFDDPMKKTLISAFHKHLLPGGYMLIGHSESLHSLSTAFKPTYFPGAVIYQKARNEEE